MSPNRITLDTGGFRVTGIAALGRPGMPLLVCLPGGSYNSAYFDVPGYSFVDAARGAGFPVAALDRPGYGGSTALPDEISFRRNADVLQPAIAELWGEHSVGSPGVVLVGHSIGGAIALYIASDERGWPLLGVSITGIHYDAPAHVTDAWNSLPPTGSIEFTRDQRRQFMYGPEGTYDAQVLDSAKAAESPIPVAELLEVVGQWPRDFAEVAAKVTVPVHYGLGEHDKLWHSSEETVAAIAKTFSAAPSVIARHVPGCGHNIDHHHGGAAFHQEQLEFATFCKTQQSQEVS